MKKAKTYRNGEVLNLRKNEIYYEYCCGCGQCHLVVPHTDISLSKYRDDFKTEQARRGR